MARLERAATRFAANALSAERALYDAFCQAQSNWLDDYALFMTLTDSLGWRDWCEWPAPLARREPAALRDAANEQSQRINFWKFCQWCFFNQWSELKAYANERGVEIVGDAPIFVAYQSADVWTRPELFELDDQGRPLVVAGVPPTSSPRPGSAGAIRSTAGASTPRTATRGGSSGYGGRLNWSTSCASTTSAASAATGKFRPMK